MGIKERMSGNEAVAYAMKQVNPDVMPAFPITPSTELPQFVANYISNGQMDTEFIPVESEHSSMSAAIGAEAAGARTMTATSSCGLAFMWEVLYVAASNRLPLAMAVVNRALSGPININAEHSDSMGARDSGWLQIYAETNQEAYDNWIQAYRISEHKDVLLPIMICQDGFITSHAVQNIELIEDEKVKAFVGEYKPEHYLLNTNETMAIGPYANGPYCMEAKRAQAQGMINAKQVILDVAAEFAAISGRKYGLFEEYFLEDADYALVAIGSACGNIKDAVDELRSLLLTELEAVFAHLLVLISMRRSLRFFEDPHVAWIDLQGSASFQNRISINCHVLVPPFNQTLLLFGGLHPLCGMGVMSLIIVI